MVFFYTASASQTMTGNRYTANITAPNPSPSSRGAQRYHRPLALAASRFMPGNLHNISRASDTALAAAPGSSPAGI